MSTNIPLPPTLSSWYKLPDGEIFRVTAIDDDQESIEIQYLDGALESLDAETWHKLGHVQAEPDEHWLDDLYSSTEEFDYVALGVAPGTEGLFDAFPSDAAHDYD